MTNKELIDKIKAEVERLENYYTSVEWYVEELLSFLDSLESEKPINPNDAMKVLDEKIALVKQRGTWDGIDVDKYMDEVRGREPEKPMNQDELEKAVVDYFEGYWPGMETAEQCNTDLRFTPPAIMRLARHFAQWGAEHTPLPEDTVLFNKGVEEGKRLMMEEAVEGEVMTNGFYPYEPRIVAPYPNCPYDFGDKVRVIVCKKED